MGLIASLKKRAKTFEESLIDIHVRTEGKVSLMECYSLPYTVRQMYYKQHNKYVEDLKKHEK